MATELDALSESVREAWQRMRYASDLTKGTVLSSTSDTEVIFHDHIHQAARVRELERENGELRAGPPEGCELSLDEMNAVIAERDRAFADAERAEAELAAIKKRIAEAPKTTAYADGDDGLTIGCGPHILACMDESEIGECFAIVKLEDGE